MLLLLTAGGAAVTAQARFVGTVVDRDGPVAGATVVLHNEVGEFQTSSSPEGSFAFTGLAPGRFEIEVSAPGYRASVGTVAVQPASAPHKTLEIELRRLDEQSPMGVESQPRVTVRRWLELGNELLNQGRQAEARKEFEKALPWLDADGQADAHRAIARTRWMQQDVDGTIEELLQAMVVELVHRPQAEFDASDSFQLLRTLLEQLARTSELEGLLAEVRRRAAARSAASAPENPAGNVPAGTGAPRERQPAGPLTPHAVGRLTVTLPGGASVPSREALRERLSDHYFPSSAQVGDAAARSPALLDREPLAGGEDHFALYVPPRYGSEDAAARKADPWGLLVWISPVHHGGPPQNPEIERLLAERRLIWVGPQDAGNARISWQRVALALVAAAEIPRAYDIDARRIIVAGYSGGGRVSSALAWQWPEVFSGAIFWFGTDFYLPVPVPFRPGGRWSPRFAPPTRAQTRLLQQSRFAFVTGDLDFNRSETRAVYRAAHNAGFEQHVYLQIPEATHYYGLRAPWLATALDHVAP